MREPQPPKHLPVPEKRVYRSLVAEYNIRDVGGQEVLVSGLEAKARARKCREIIDREGMTTVDRWGQPKAHPLLATERDARAAWLQAVKLLNLDLEP